MENGRLFQPTWLRHTSISWKSKQCQWFAFSSDAINYNHCFDLLQWPFIRIFGLQEPASVLFSFLNFFAHYTMYQKFRKTVRFPSPMTSIWTFFALVNKFSQSLVVIIIILNITILHYILLLDCTVWMVLVNDFSC